MIGLIKKEKALTKQNVIDTVGPMLKPIIESQNSLELFVNNERKKELDSLNKKRQDEIKESEYIKRDKTHGAIFLIWSGSMVASLLFAGMILAAFNPSGAIPVHFTLVDQITFWATWGISSILMFISLFFLCIDWRNYPVG